MTTSTLDLNALLEAWYTRYGMQPHPELMSHDRLHALLGEGPDWRGEVRVVVIDYVYKSLRRDQPLTMTGARLFLKGVVQALHIYEQPDAHDFLSDAELAQRISASVRIIRHVGIENI